MAVLQNMREKFGIAISVIIALSLLYFIAPMDDLMTLFGRPQNVGEISGKAVSYEDYQEEVEKFTTINQIVTGSTVQNEQTQKQIREMAWQSFLDRFMFVKQAKAAGIKVGEEEIVNLTTGDNISPMISGNPIFADQNGEFSVDNLVEFVSNLDNDESGRSRLYWKYIQNSIFTQQYYAKYGSLFTSSACPNALTLANDIAQNNTTADIQYVTVNYPFQKDSTINVSSSEIKAFYKSHKKFYKQNASRDIEYVVFEVVPSAEDIQEASKVFDESYSEFCTTDNMKSFLLKNSDRSLSNYWYKAGELATVNAGIDEQIFKGGKNVTEIVADGNTLYAAKVMDSAMISDSVYVKHILLQGTGAKEKADSLVKELAKGANFANMAAEYSVDKGSQDDGVIGNIGWLTQTYMIPGFESVITAQVGKAEVINTQYGTHIVVVTKKTPAVSKKQVAILEKTTLASKETFNKFYADANRFSSIAGGTYEGYQKAVDSLKVYSHPMNITEATERFGSVDNAKEVTRWAFDAKKGKASQILTVDNNFFFIAALKNVHKEGYTPVEEVSEMIKSKLYSDKLSVKIAEEVKAKIAGLTSMEEIAKALGEEVDTKEGITFSTMNGAAVEPALLGAAFKAPLNTVSGPVKGGAAVYVFNVSARETGSFYTEEDAENFAKQKAQYGSQMVMPAMAELADVKDNRARFF